MIEPIKPDEVGDAKAIYFPDAVIESFNELIAMHFANGSAKVLQKDAEERMVAKGIDRDSIYDLGYMDVEEMYRSQGWKVFFDKPVGYAGESFDAYFEFSR